MGSTCTAQSRCPCALGSIGVPSLVRDPTGPPCFYQASGSQQHAPSAVSTTDATEQNVALASRVEAQASPLASVETGVQLPRYTDCRARHTVSQLIVVDASRTTGLAQLAMLSPRSETVSEVGRRSRRSSMLVRV